MATGLSPCASLRSAVLIARSTHICDGPTRLLLGTCRGIDGLFALFNATAISAIIASIGTLLIAHLRARNYSLWFPRLSVIFIGMTRGRQYITPVVNASATATIPTMNGIIGLVF